MSKGNMLLGHARGKVGSLVFSRSNGEQIVRAKADVVKNPQTEKQMIQRIILNTVAQAYSNMSAIVDHSFEGVSAGQASMSEFMRANMQAIRTKVATQISANYSFEEIYDFSPLKTNKLAINEYVISKGKLPEVVATLEDGVDYAQMPLSANTYQGVINEYGLKRGDQLTFIGIVYNSGRGTKSFQYCRVILDPRDDAGNELPLSTAFIADGAIVSPSPRNEGSFAELSFADGNVTFGWGGTQLQATAIIVSRQLTDGTWARSNAQMVVNSLPDDGVSLGAALEMAASAAVSTLDDRYLNNSGTGTIAGGTSTAATLSGVQVNSNSVARGASVSAGSVLPGGDTISCLVSGNISEVSSTKSYKLGLVKNGAIILTGSAAISSAEFTSYQLSIDTAQLSSPALLALIVDGVATDTYCTLTW